MSGDMDSKAVYIIAEAGVNHNGELQKAFQLIDVASDAGVDAVKFQTFNPDSLVTPDAGKADYQKQTTDAQESQHEMLQRLALSHADHYELIKYCKERKVVFLSSPFDIDSVNFLDSLHLPFFKIPSGEITNLPYLRHVASKNKPVVISTGMARMGEVESALRILMDAGLRREQISILHCTTEYPAPFNEVNLRAMRTMAQAFGCRIGYSDHTPGIEISVAAVAMGATIIEKHFTLDKNMEGPDHKASLEPDELKSLVASIRNVEVALGTGFKEPSLAELKNTTIARKAIVAATDIKPGEIFTEQNLTSKRISMVGISPLRWDEMIGRKAARSYHKDEAID